MTSIKNLRRAVIQRLRTFFSPECSANKIDFRATRGMHPNYWFVETEQASERNFAALSDAFGEIQDWAEYLVDQLKNKKLNRRDLADHLAEFAEMTELGRSHLRDRQRIEQRFVAHYVGCHSPVNGRKVYRTPQKVGSNG